MIFDLKDFLFSFEVSRSANYADLCVPTNRITEDLSSPVAVKEGMQSKM